jgi:arsenate reductase-like glutaredoxin family protein
MFERENKMEPREVAEIVIDRVDYYCRNNSGDTLVECLAHHNPDELDVFIDAYLKGKEAEELDKAIENLDEYWDEVKKEYEKLWDEEMSLQLGQLLSDEMVSLYENIVQNDELDDACKARRLKAYAEVLDKFGDAIMRALQEKKPLTEDDLLDWYDKMGDVTFGLKNYNYYEIMGYYIGFYDGLSDTGKLEVLKILLDEIGNVLYDIDNKLSELGDLINES